MNTDQIFAQCKALEALADSAGFFRAEVYFQINWIYTKPFDLRIEMRTDPTDYKTKIDTHFGTDQSDEISVLFDQVTAWINEQDNPTQVRKKKFVTDLAHLVEEAEALELDPAPLRQVFTAMTTNLLEHRP